MTSDDTQTAWAAHDRNTHAAVAAMCGWAPRRETNLGVSPAGSDTSAPACTDWSDFRRWIGSWLPDLLPHFGATFGIVMKSTLGVKLVTSATIDLPAGYMQKVTSKQNVGCPVLSNWLFVRKPQFFSVAGGHLEDNDLKKIFDEYGLRNVFLHGHVDADRDLASFFGLFNLHDAFRPEGEIHAEQIALRVHRVLLGLHDTQQLCDVVATGLTLTPAEESVRRWLCEGKTNWEISRILNKSEWTVKTQVQCILHKLNAPSRRHLMVAAQRGERVLQR